jgi:hypothetical protein
MSAGTDELTQLATLLFHKSGLAENVQRLSSFVEEELKGIYGVSSDEDDEQSTSNYGGVCYYDLDLVENGKFIYQIEKRTTTEQKELLRQLCKDDLLTVSVTRTDTGSLQNWEFVFSVPTSFNKSESNRLDIDMHLTVPVYSPQKYTLEAFTSDAISAEAIAKITMLYKLQF